MLIRLVLGLALSAGIGVSLGLIGGGGSIITVPVLVYVLGVDAHEAVGMSLAVVGVTSLVGAALHRRRGAVRTSTGVLFGGSGILGAFFGSRLTYLLSSSALLLTFAGLMILISILMLTRSQADLDRAAGKARNTPRAILVGLAIGVLTGFLGVGGGFVIVPALVLFGGLGIKEAIGTSLLVIAINCAAGLAGHLVQGGFDPGLAALVAAMAAAGTLGGTAMSHRVSPAGLRRGFALFVLLVAAFLVAKNYEVIFP